MLLFFSRWIIHARIRAVFTFRRALRSQSYARWKQSSYGDAFASTWIWDPTTLCNQGHSLFFI